jgi:hypothetical protein
VTSETSWRPVGTLRSLAVSSCVLFALCASAGGCSDPVRTASRGASNDADAPDRPDHSDESHASHTHMHDVSHESDASHTHEANTEAGASDIPDGSSESIRALYCAWCD